MELFLLFWSVAGVSLTHAFSVPSSCSPTKPRASLTERMAARRNNFEDHNKENNDNPLEAFLSSISFDGQPFGDPNTRDYEKTNDFSPMISQAFKECHANIESTLKVPKRLYFPISSNQVAVNDFFKDEWLGRLPVPGKEFPSENDERTMSRKFTSYMRTDTKFPPRNDVKLTWQMLKRNGSTAEGQQEKKWFDAIESSFETLDATCNYVEIGVSVNGGCVTNIRPGGENGYEIIPDDEWLVQSKEHDHSYFSTHWEHFIPKMEGRNPDMGQATIVPGMDHEAQDFYSGYALVIDLNDYFYGKIGIKTSTIHRWPYDEKLTEKQTLFKAAKEGLTEDVEKLLEKKLAEKGEVDSIADFCTYEDNLIRWTLLHEAAKHDQAVIIDLLMQQQYDTDINAYHRFPKYKGNTGSEVTDFFESQHCDHESILVALLGAGADSNNATMDEFEWYEYPEKYYPYDVANNLSTKRQLLKHGANPNVGKATNFLATAIRRLDVEEVQLLLESGVDLHCGKFAYPPFEHNPLYVVVNRRNPFVPFPKEQSHHKQFEIIKLLLEYGAKTHSKGPQEYRTFLHEVYYGRHYELLSLLLSAKAETPAAMKEEHFSCHEVVTKLLEDRDTRGRTLLMESVTDGNLKITQLMLELGTNPQVTDNNNNTLLHLARDKETYELLLEYGVDETKANNDHKLPKKPLWSCIQQRFVK